MRVSGMPRFLLEARKPHSIQSPDFRKSFFGRLTLADTKMAATNDNDVSTSYDRKSALKSFDDTKEGVKGLLRIFYHPPDEYSINNTSDSEEAQFSIPVIDLNGLSDPTKRKGIIADAADASESWGFFQIVNHGLPVDVLEEIKDGAPTNWRDTFTCYMTPTPKTEDLPEVCREILVEYSNQVIKLGKLLLELLSEGLGLKRSHLNDIDCGEGLLVIGHYYPACPQSELTLGTTKHADNTFITVLLQDNIGGLQVLHHTKWIDVPPVPGSLVVNIGDFLQLISNDKFKSVEHRELLSEDNPAKYRETTLRDYNAYYRESPKDNEPSSIRLELGELGHGSNSYHGIDLSTTQTENSDGSDEAKTGDSFGNGSDDGMEVSESQDGSDDEQSTMFNGKPYKDLKLDDLSNVVFKSGEEAKMFYLHYLVAKGFSIRKYKLAWNSENTVIIRREMVCAREGVRNKGKKSRVCEEDVDAGLEDRLIHKTKKANKQKVLHRSYVKDSERSCRGKKMVKPVSSRSRRLSRQNCLAQFTVKYDRKRGDIMHRRLGRNIIIH
ncbi:hypothetical protein ACLB2K_038475 [Fragaria x ananassa]